jgi:hypothetical protein
VCKKKGLWYFRSPFFVDFLHGEQYRRRLKAKTPPAQIMMTQAEIIKQAIPAISP